MACTSPDFPERQDALTPAVKVTDLPEFSSTSPPRPLATYINPNPQLNQNVKSEAVKKLEREIDAKVECGALSEAQALNDRLVQQIKEEKLLEAMEARDFHSKQLEAQAKPSKQKQPKLKWTFVGKERWEAKGNM
ncbi:hypothetical protein K493DRAFT_63740 [Basidiobolus meristosporus CBS 931.73]|uniref:Uncharacterized protein n=1 Tax=Basidiobolus meristosporus CBS 931.73 TaxID=1314790 RepID=A0A1Y1Z240_9FUNG|nr:hypothetical protein K493DRAFT_63740 [Basidiobolus meristosporus CBS 931.73]|eukprot:ORY03905.1 hypothetical protein K493DRAFT_63740 [Basidiobolus meristosporus CBS 931.73]